MRSLHNDKKTIYVAHPVGGDVEGNMKKILEICRLIHTQDSKVIPLAPYLVGLHYLKDTVEEERDLGIEANTEHFKRGMIDEVWLYGTHISPGMKEEILLAHTLEIPVVPMTDTTREAYVLLQKEST